MNDSEDIAYCTELGIDSDLKPLLGRGDISICALQCYNNWRRGFSESDIGNFYGIDSEEAESNIAKIKQLLPSITLAVDIELRDQITASKSRSKERERELSDALSQPADVLIERRRNPIDLLKRFREEISAPVPDTIKTLRQKDLEMGTVAGNSELTLERESRIVKELRRQKDMSVKGSMSKKRVSHPGATDPAQKTGMIASGDKKKKRSRRGKKLTVRVEDAILEKLQEHVRKSGSGLSKVVRSAIELYLESSPEPENGRM